MLYLSSVRVAPGVRSALAVACGVALSFGQAAWADDSVEPVIVSASRMPQLLRTAPIGATVITSEQIQRSGVADANEAIRKLAGVVGKTDLFGGREYLLDVRGYGDAAASNLVVMVDGVRISESEQLSARLTALPLNQIDRIEIVRGGSSVLWGGGATAGVVNVILKKNSGSYARIAGSVSSYGGQDLNASGSTQVGALTVDGTVNRARSKGFREHSAYKQDSGSFGLAFGGDNWSQRFRVQQETQWSQWPDSLTFAQYEQDPRMATGTNESTNDEGRFSSHTEIKAGDVSAQIDFGSRRRRYASLNYGRMVESNQLTPKVVYNTKVSDIEWAAIFGVDFHRWRLDTPTTYGGDKAHDSHTAVFMNHSVNLPSKTRIDAGYRRERAIARAEGYSQYDQRSNLDASEIGVSQQIVTSLTGYGRVARSYRLPNVDDNGWTLSGSPLRPQKSRDKEVGLRWLTPTQQVNLRAFRQDNTDEIMQAAVDPLSGMTANFNATNPTRRHGLELDGRWQVTKDLDLRTTWQHISARYVAGPFQGNDIVMVAPQSSTLRASYKLDDRQSVEVGVQHRGEMRLGNDDNNQCTRRIPASTQFDTRYSWTDREWSFAFGVSNLGNQVGYNYAYYCTTGGLYPEQGRAYKATISRQF